MRVTSALPLLVALPARTSGFNMIAGAPLLAASGGSMVNCLGAAAGFFNNVRTPAALVAGAAMGSVWASVSGDSKKLTKQQLIFTTLAATAVFCQLGAVFVATASGVQLLNTGLFDPMAKDGLAFLVREMEFSYLFVRVNFITGLLAFISSLGVRALSAIPNANLAKATACLIGTSIFSCLAFLETTTAPYNSFPHMFYRMIVLMFTSLGKAQPVLVAGGAALMGAGLFFMKSAAMEALKGKAD